MILECETDEEDTSNREDSDDCDVNLNFEEIRPYKPDASDSEHDT